VESLELYGWSPDVVDAGSDRSLVPGRVVASLGESHTVVTSDGPVSAMETGHIRFAADSALDLPTVGDWVGLRRVGDAALVDHVYPRRTFLARRKAGRADEPQLVAANVDVVFVITAATAEHNPRRLERYLASVRAGGAVPEIVLNKVDLVSDTAPFLAAMPPGVRVHALSALHGAGIDSIELGGRRTYAFVGSSGVGKSTIVNRLLGTEQQVVSALARDDTGRHTTTHRELFVVPERDAVIIDTPGMRELGMWSADGLDETFSEIAALAERCKFRDCGHDTEPGCAVIAAIAEGALEETRLQAWRKLLREARRVEMQAHLRNSQERKRARAIRHKLREKRR
jgi:ribosome biogenesis GTPase / thiamine phosphate phosphatase